LQHEDVGTNHVYYCDLGILPIGYVCVTAFWTSGCYYVFCSGTAAATWQYLGPLRPDSKCLWCWHMT